jgi:ketosteroid isomerase-like protein
VEGSNLDAVQRNVSNSQGVDVAPVIRALLAGDTNAIPPQLAADWAAWVDMLDPDIEIDMSGADMPDLGVLRGLEGYRELWSRWVEDWEHYSWIHSNWSEAGEHVIFDAEIHATGRGSGVEVVWETTQVYTFRDGRVIRWRVFSDRTSALAAIENP